VTAVAEFASRSILIGAGATLIMDLWAAVLRRFGVPSLNFAHLGRSIGVSFAALLLATLGLEWARSPTLLPALFIGIATVLAPLLVLQPALGAGIASSRTSRPVLNSLKSLVTHTVFGIGLFLAARVVAWLVPAAT
jgi:hypothetical protein